MRFASNNVLLSTALAFVWSPVHAAAQGHKPIKITPVPKFPESLGK
jgi:hypothetical protein